jgi:exopolysaccharide biosynthesis polyprenyl glycosylphosphotransferase
VRGLAPELDSSELAAVNSVEDPEAQAGIQQAHAPSKDMLRLGGSHVARRRRGRVKQRKLLVDIAMLVLAVCTEMVTASATAIPTEGSPWTPIFAALTLGLLSARGMYRPRIAGHFLDEMRTVIAATATAAMMVAFMRVLLGTDPNAASQAVRDWLFASAYLIAGRGTIAILGPRLRSAGHGGSPTLIVGAGRVGRLMARRLLERPEIGLRPVGFVDNDPLDSEEPRDCSVLGPIWQLEPLVRANAVEHAVLSFSRASSAEELAVSRHLQSLGVSVSVVPRLFEDIPDRISIERIGGLPVLSIYPSGPGNWQFKAKYLLDRVLAAVAIVITAPIMIAIGLWILLTMGRPVVFRQRRIGLDGREFEMLKFRSMVRGAERQLDELRPYNERSGPAFKIKNDPRVTPAGRFMRRTSLDELPQLINVLKGDMTLVGPRPPLPQEVAEYTSNQRRRLDVKPGITGLWQVSGRNDIEFDEWVELDLYYIHNWSLWMEFTILLRTVGVVMSGRGAY